MAQDNVLLDPLTSAEKRILEDGAYWVVNMKTQQKTRQIPEDFSFLSIPMLISVCDQGPLNVPALDMVVYKLKMTVLNLYDTYHRAWNDVKNSLRQATGSLFKVLLSFSLFFNINYGPAGSRSWMQKKIHNLKDFAANFGPNSEAFLQYLPFICEERNLEFPQTAEERTAVFNSLLTMKTLTQHGPVVKLMRWYSFWESYHHFQGECWANKMVMTLGSYAPDSGLAENILGPVEGQKMTHQEQLRRLKMQLGSWGLAPRLITPESMWKCQLLVSIGTPCWTEFATKAMNVKTPQQVADEMSMKAVDNNWAEEVLQIIDNGFYSVGSLYPGHGFSSQKEDECLSIHFSFLCKLPEDKPAVSICATGLGLSVLGLVKFSI